MRYNLSEIGQLIKDRRTIYPEDYTDRVVHEEIVKNVLNSALWAPTHRMTQPWFFHVFMGDARRDLAEVLSSVYRKTTPEDKFLPNKYERIQTRISKTSAVIAVCMHRDPKESVPEIEEVMSVSCAIQNITLHCTAYGLGSYLSTPGYKDHKDIKNFLSLGEKDKCMGFLYMGYPSVEWPTSHRKPLEYVTEWHKD